MKDVWNDTWAVCLRYIIYQNGMLCLFVFIVVVSSGPVSGSEEEEGTWAADFDGVYSGLGRGGH